MDKKLDKSEYSWLTTRRIVALTDGIFAFAMTLLILNLEVPPLVEGESVDGLVSFLITLWPRFFDYLLSFILLASFWIVHHRQFHFIKRADGGLLWINIYTLIFVCLIPFSTSVASEYGNLWVAEVVFEANLLMVGLLFYLNWWYVTKKKLLIDGVALRDIVIGMKKNLVIPILSVVAIILAFIMPSRSTAVYLAIPFVFSWIVRTTK